MIHCSEPSSSSLVETASIALSFLTLVATIAIAYLANKWAHRYWRKQKQEETNIQLKVVRFQEVIAAHKAIWGLLPYLSGQENGKNIIQVDSSGDKKQYRFVFERAEAFIDDLRVTFYDQGHGIFLSKEIKDVLYHAKYSIAGFRDQFDLPREGRVTVKNEDFVNVVFEAYETSHAIIKKWVDSDPAKAVNIE